MHYSIAGFVIPVGTQGAIKAFVVGLAKIPRLIWHKTLLLSFLNNCGPRIFQMLMSCLTGLDQGQMSDYKLPPPTHKNI